MVFQPADYAIGGLVILMLIVGMFRGFSGTLAFVVAMIASSAVAYFGWTQFSEWFSQPYYHALGVFVATLLTFGLVRIVIKRLVNGLLAQPTDALLGGLIGLIAGVLLILGWAWSGICVEYSAIVSEIVPYVR